MHYLLHSTISDHQDVFFSFTLTSVFFSELFHFFLFFYWQLKIRIPLALYLYIYLFLFSESFQNGATVNIISLMIELHFFTLHSWYSSKQRWWWSSSFLISGQRSVPKKAKNNQKKSHSFTLWNFWFANFIQTFSNKTKQFGVQRSVFYWVRYIINKHA